VLMAALSTGPNHRACFRPNCCIGSAPAAMGTAPV
jgi:hypothetical protein